MMHSLTVKLYVALTYFTAVYLTTEAADTCPATRASCLPGLPGRDGRDGEPGRDGDDGVAGPPGRDGRDGLPGPVGPVGPQGIAGMNGTDGEQGPVGPVGPQGPVGPVGPVGAPGLDGRNGSDGSPGAPGTVPDAVIEGLKQDILGEVLKRLPCEGLFRNNPATSCKEIHDCDPNAASGYYWVNTTTGPLQVYCQMDTNNCGNITGGWMRAAYIDMTDVSNSCPQGLNYTDASSTRMCTRSHNGQFDACSSVTFPTYGIPYTKICGRARGYQFGNTLAFNRYRFVGETIDNAYASGLSVTYGSPRNHIWTFAAGRSKNSQFSHNGCCSCPCAAPSPGPAAPPPVGDNYFCESGNPLHDFSQRHWYLDDPLWDSNDCGIGSTCCDRGGPWFATTLGQEVRDDVEVRLCNHYYLDVENVGVDQLEIFIY